MKLIKKILTLGLGLTLVGGALVGISTKKVAKEAKADYESYIPVNRELFEVWDDNAGDFGDENSTFWGENYSFQAMGPFFRGERNEGWTGTLKTRTWKQHTQYIYFQLGGANNNVDYTPVHLKIYYGNEGWFQLFYNDTFVENEMLMRSFKIPDNAYNALKAKGDDFDMYIEIVDTQTSSFGFANFGYLNVNQTADSTGDALRWYINHLNRDDREYSVNKRKQILENYYLNGSLRELFLKPYNDISDSFDSNQDFVNHWYFDYHYAEYMNWDFHVDRAIGFDSYRPEESTNIPFNNENGFFRGWYENELLGGFVGGDASRYRFRSRAFTVSGTGLISIKMAGTASLHVIDVDTGADLVWADLLTYSKEGDTVNLATSSFNTVTMIRHFINLEAYIGRTVQLAIADVEGGNQAGWSALYVDELVTNYESYPGFGVDTFTQTNNSGTFNAYRTDKYINSSLYNAESNPTGLKYVLEAEINKADDNAILNTVDLTPAKKAYDFLQSYYLVLRSASNKFAYSEVAAETKQSLVNVYKELDFETRTLIKSSVDIEYNESFVDNWWINPVSTSHQIIDAFAPLVYSLVKYIVSFKGNGGVGVMDNVSNIEGTYSLPHNEFSAPSEQQFAGWKVNGVGETLQEDAEITVTSDIYLAAQWEDIPVTKYLVSFDANGGTGSMSSVEIIEGETFVLPDNEFEAPEGFRFAGWNVGDDTTLRAPGYEFVVESETVIHAVWEAIPTYTVSFDANGGTGTMESITTKENTLVTLPENGFTAPQGKRFVCWKFGEENKQPGDEILVVSNVTIRAIWETIPVVYHTVRFKANGGSGSMSSVSVEEGKTYALPENGFLAPEGKKFSGWKVDNDATLRQPGYEITVNSDVVVSAMWEHNPAVKYTVSFDANGGTGSMDSIRINSGEQLILPACSFVAPEGKQFDYWLISSVKYQPGDKITVVGNTLIKASWKNAEQVQPKDNEQQSGDEQKEESNSKLTCRIFISTR